MIRYKRHLISINRAATGIADQSAKLRILLEETRPGILAFWGNDGTVSHQDAKTCIRLLGQEVFPAVREMAKEFDLKSPFETNQPVSLDYMNALGQPARAAAE